MIDRGEVPAGSTVTFPFTTHVGATGAPVAPSDAFEAADVRIYKSGSATERASAAGVTMTSPFDAVTGLHRLSIDLSDNTDPGFYSVGAYYDVVLVPDETVDGVAVVAVLGSFRIRAAEAVAGTPKADVSHVAAQSQTARDLGAALAGTLAAGTHQPQSGDAFARVGANGAGLTSLGDARVANLDAAVSSRAATGEADAAVAGLNDLSQAEAQTAAADALAAYGGPTRVEATADKDEILADIAAIPEGASQASVDAMQEDVDAIKAKTDTITSGTAIQVINAVVRSGRIEVEEGDDYTVATGQPLDYPITTPTDLSDADDVRLIVGDGDPVSMTELLNAGLATQAVRFEITAAVLADLGTDHFDIEAIYGLQTRTVARGIFEKKTTL